MDSHELFWSTRVMWCDYAESSCIGLTEQHPNLVVLCTFSKAWGLMGLRVGYALGNHPIVHATPGYFRITMGSRDIMQGIPHVLSRHTCVFG